MLNNQHLQEAYMKDRFETFAGSIVELNRYLQKIKDKSGQCKYWDSCF